MERFKCKIMYDGTHFSGYQVQPEKRTVQGVIESVLTKLHKGTHIRISASGRTDAGVHARGQIIHFDSPLQIPEENWLKAMNTLLPDDISVVQISRADPGFHSRFDASGKEYRYFVSLGTVRDPFRRNYSYQAGFKLDYEAMNESVKHLIGTHDFTSFCSAKTEVEDRVRTIRTIEFVESGDELMFRFVGNGFLYNMVRILVGTILEVGTGRKRPSEMKEILEKKDRSCAGKTAPGHGLYLWEVFYD
ncbi:tRNA pseudouridine(38-40) synthase TruA [Peribacillus deserti]|uniref:tRNA pseudouridine synthase A n=1 Tax=Peribacillus deserti TaxID=673318 RepID=A0A2N5MAG6_9BACI|nr:tRNA pseudouridine(38-40) synthase TruA [Peribacillus deserti]PLT31359.1 tRNA pseudouridine(38-40) synthase TruA [Peribacillus deserti]